MPLEFNDLQVGERVRYIGDRHYKGQLATVISKTDFNTSWKPNQSKDTHVPIRFDDGLTYGAYRKWLERVQEIPNWEL